MAIAAGLASGIDELGARIGQRLELEARRRASCEFSHPEASSASLARQTQAVSRRVTNTWKTASGLTRTRSTNVPKFDQHVLRARCADKRSHFQRVAVPAASIFPSAIVAL